MQCLIARCARCARSLREHRSRTLSRMPDLEPVDESWSTALCVVAHPDDLESAPLQPLRAGLIKERP